MHKLKFQFRESTFWAECPQIHNNSKDEKQIGSTNEGKRRGLFFISRRVLLSSQMKPVMMT